MVLKKHFALMHDPTAKGVAKREHASIERRLQADLSCDQ